MASTSNRIFGLDLLRAIAILQVVQGHAYQLHYQFWEYSSWAAKIISLFIFNFVDGVDLFFVLSGFLIGGILIRTLEEHGTSYKIILNFWIKRWFRTIPIYIIVLICNIVLYISFSKNFISGIKELYHFGIIRYFFFIQNFIKSSSIFFTEGWSLAVEEWSYLILPIAFILCLRLTKLSIKNAILWVCLWIIVSVHLFKIVAWFDIHKENDLSAWAMLIHFRETTLIRLDAVVYGVLAAWFYHYQSPKWNLYSWLFLSIGLVGCYFYREFSAWSFSNIQRINFWFPVIFENTYGCFFIAFLLPVLSKWKLQKGILGKIIVHISLISYSMYLLNLSFLIGIIKHFNPAQTITDSYINLTVYWIMLIGLSTISYYYVEKPLTDLREYFIIKPREKKPELMSA
jgi:peptidoglycan/LPS O-acetylase OafA/YrhL